jgi:hypothetical protein
LDIKSNQEVGDGFERRDLNDSFKMEEIQDEEVVFEINLAKFNNKINC